MTQMMLGAMMLLLGARTIPERKVLPLPKGLAPRMVLIHVTGEEGVLLIHQTRQEFVQELREVVIVINGKQVVERTVSRRPVIRQDIQKVLLKSVKVVTAAGKKIEAKALPNLLKTDTLVLISADGQKIDPYWLQAIKGNTLVLVLPATGYLVNPKPAEFEKKR